jgi:plasmid stabilization system protein ParE
MKYRLDRRAREEFFAAAARYDQEQPGLGREFAIEFITVIERLVQFPESGPRVSNNLRWSLLRRFPYAIYYQIECDIVYVLAVLHTKRNPPEKL